MVIEQQITGAIITGIKELYGADVAANQVQLQKTKKEFKGHLTLVVFPFLRMSKKSPEQTAQEIGEYLLRHEPAVAEFNVIKGFLNLTIACACWIDLLNEINGILGAQSAYGAAARAHGEGLLVKGDNLYALASINKEGGYQNYDEGWLIRYQIGQDGSLERKDYTRVGKNTDEARLNLYNDHILVSAIGGYQNYGFGNGDTCITAATLSDDGGLSTGNTRNITLPNTLSLIHI